MGVTFQTSLSTPYYPSAIYVQFFGNWPSIFNYRFEEENKQIFLSLSDINKIIDVLKPDEIIQCSSHDKCKKEQYQRFPELKDIKNWTHTTSFVFKDKRYIIDIHSSINSFIDEIAFYYDKSYHLDTKEFEEISKRIKPYFYFADNSPKESSVKMIYFDGKEFQTISSKIKSPEINLLENYNDDIEIMYDKLVEFLKSRNTGICFLRGVPGTGKSYMLRYLMKDQPNDYILIPNSMSAHIASPDFLQFMLKNKDSIFILEDCEQILFDRTINPDNLGISGILNIADGLMSDVLNIKFICTFNTDISKIDKSLLREGRCVINYEFRPLSVEKTKHLLNKLGKDITDCHEMTLAQIYNYQDKLESKSKSKKIGF